MKRKQSLLVCSQVLVAFALFLEGCSDTSSPSEATKSESPSKTRTSLDIGDPLTKRFISEIEKSKNVIEPTRLSPPSTNQGFWLQGGDLSTGNKSRGLLFATWETGNDPQGNRSSGYAVAAFKGWIFLLPDQRAEVVYASYLYFLGNQNAILASVAKDMSRCKINTRSFSGTWNIRNGDVVIKPEESIDPRQFSSAEGSARFDLKQWFAERDERAERRGNAGLMKNVAVILDDFLAEREAGDRDRKMWQGHAVDRARSTYARTDAIKADGRSYYLYIDVIEIMYFLMRCQQQIDSDISKSGALNKSLASDNVEWETLTKDSKQLSKWLEKRGFKNGFGFTGENSARKLPVLEQDYTQIWPIEANRNVVFKMQDGDEVKLTYKCDEYGIYITPQGINDFEGSNKRLRRHLDAVIDRVNADRDQNIDDWFRIVGKRVSDHRRRAYLSKVIHDIYKRVLSSEGVDTSTIGDWTEEDYAGTLPVEDGRVFEVKLKGGSVLRLKYVKQSINAIRATGGGNYERVTLNAIVVQSNSVDAK